MKMTWWQVCQNHSTVIFSSNRKSLFWACLFVHWITQKATSEFCGAFHKYQVDRFFCWCAAVICPHIAFSWVRIVRLGLNGAWMCDKIVTEKITCCFLRLSQMCAVPYPNMLWTDFDGSFRRSVVGPRSRLLDFSGNLNHNLDTGNFKRYVSDMYSVWCIWHRIVLAADLGTDRLVISLP